MSTEHSIEDSIDKAAATVGSVWLVYSFVTANLLSGFEDMPSSEAVTQITDLASGRGYPSPETFEVTLEGGQVGPATLDVELANYGCDGDPEALLECMDADTESVGTGDDIEADAAWADHALTKWLSAFLNGGQAH